MYEVTVDELAGLLREAENAHGEYEKQIGHADAGWPQWYARFILEKLEKDEIDL